MKNIDIRTHFVETNINGIKALKLKPGELTVFIQKLPKAFREKYISDQKLDEIILLLGSNRVETIKEKIPTTPQLKSGEFGELVINFLIPEIYSKGYYRLMPNKFEWKEARDFPAHFTDVVIFCRSKKSRDSKHDHVISIESKAKATQPTKGESILNTAIGGAVKDNTSRLAETIFQIKVKYKDEVKVGELRFIERFSDAAKFQPYAKHFKAIGVVDNSHHQLHLDSVGVIPTGINTSLQVLLIGIEQMQNTYEIVYAQILAT